jgi:hypothetical protein
MYDFQYNTKEFELLEKKWLDGKTVWKKYSSPVYTFTEDKCYNRTFLVENKSEFTFGFD